MTTSGCDVSSRCFSSSTELLIPFVLSCRIFISLCLVLGVFCLLCVCGSVQVWGRMGVCVVARCGESGDGQVVFGLGCRE